MKSCGSLDRHRATLPEILEASTEFGTAQRDDGVGTSDAPVHAGPLEPGPDCHFASSLQDAGGGTQTLCVELRIAHAMAVAKNVDCTFCNRHRKRYPKYHAQGLCTSTGVL